MKEGRLKEIVKELQGASKMHLKQSKEIAAHIDDMSPAKMNSPLNHAPRPAKGNSERVYKGHKHTDAAPKMTTPLNKKDRTGDSVSWKYGKGTYSGTCLNASCSRARTKNGKVKVLPKNRGK
jgi:hypothetical protein